MSEKTQKLGYARGEWRINGDLVVPIIIYGYRIEDDGTEFAIISSLLSEVPANEVTQYEWAPDGQENNLPPADHGL